jgi:hypothetical protein
VHLVEQEAEPLLRVLCVPGAPLPELNRKELRAASKERSGCTCSGCSQADGGLPEEEGISAKKRRKDLTCVFACRLEGLGVWSVGPRVGVGRVVWWRCVWWGALGWPGERASVHHAEVVEGLGGCELAQL